jgi:hypothetical protein
MALLRKFTGPVRITFKKVSLALSRYFMGVLLPSSGNYYAGETGGMLGGYTAANSNGMYIAAIGDTTVSGTNIQGGRLQRINYDGSIAFQTVSTDYIHSPGDSSQYNTTLTISSSGNVHVGSYVNSPAGSGIRIKKYTSGGSLTWTTLINYLMYDVTAMATDSSENVYFGGRKKTGDFDVSQRYPIASLNSSGNTLRWQIDYGTDRGTAGTFGYGLSTYSTSVYATGIFYASTYVQYGFFAKFSQSSGALEFEQIYSSDTRFTSLIQNSSGDCYIGGYIIGGSLGGVLIKTNSSGTKQWATTIATNGATAKIAMDSSENIYMISRHSSTVVSISKYNSSGTIQWQRDLTMSYETSGSGSISITSDDSIFLTLLARDTGLTRYYPFVAYLKSDGTGTGTYTVDGQTYTYAASSRTVSTHSGSFSSFPLGSASQSRMINSITPDSTTDNLTLLKTRV